MRKYQIISDLSSLVPGYIPIKISELDKIINHSADHILCNVLEYLPKSKDNQIIKQLFDKIKLGGTLVLEIHDIKRICLDFIDNKINIDNFLSFVANKDNLLIVDDILAQVDAQFLKIISQYNKPEYLTALTIERINI